MRIRQKILSYFSILSIGLFGVSFIVVYSLFANYRTDEFRQRIKDKTFTTLQFLAEVQQIDHDLLQTMDKYTINNLYKEKLLIYDGSKKLIYASIDDTRIEFHGDILGQLSTSVPEIEYEENDFDVVGVLFEFNNKKYYGIAKAYDDYGLAKISYLKYMLIIIFIFISLMVLLSSFVLSREISQPINRMAQELSQLNPDSRNSLVTIPSSGDETELLAKRFNELMKRLNDAFSFQKHAVHHISHELKTPIAKLVSNFERMQSETDMAALKKHMQSQMEDTKNLGDIINTLLEISKVESGSTIDMENVRVDEMVFDLIQEFGILHESFAFDVEIDESIDNEEKLTIRGSRKLVRLALVNLAANCVQYSNDGRARIRISSGTQYLLLSFINSGSVILEHEKQFIFQHFYRGQNSLEKRGFGLGLVLTAKIIELHKGRIEYENPSPMMNVFNVYLPLSTN